MSVDVRHPPINKYTRPGAKITAHKGVCCHWTATPRATAENIYAAFERNRVNGVYASAQYIVGMDGKVIEYVPPDEIAYHAGTDKAYTPMAETLWMDQPHKALRHPYFYLVGIEICHKDIIGKFTDAAIYATQQLCVDLWHRYDYGDPVTHIYRHSDMTFKGYRNVPGELTCPRWWCENYADWLGFRLSVKQELI